MSSETPPRPDPEGAPAQPFTRGRIQWSRPPQPVFRVGPLPGPGPAVPRKAGAGILTGSMVPPPRSAEPAEAPAAEFEPEPAPAPGPVPVSAAAPEPEPEPVPAPPEEAPRRLPSVVVTPALHATVSAAIQTVRKNDRWVLVAAVLAVAITAGFVWLATLPAGGTAELDLDAPPPPAAGLTVELTDPPLPVEAEPAAVAEPDPPQTAPRPARRTAVSPAPVREAAAPRPVIDTTPLVTPTQSPDPPTPAEALPGDPEAPIPTAPPPLD